MRLPFILCRYIADKKRYVNPQSANHEAVVLHGLRLGAATIVDAFVSVEILGKIALTFKAARMYVTTVRPVGALPVEILPALVVMKFDVFRAHRYAGNISILALPGIVTGCVAMLRPQVFSNSDTARWLRLCLHFRVAEVSGS